MTGRTARRRSLAPTLALVGALAGALVVAGCQSEGAQSPSPSPSVSSSSASPTASPSPSPSPTEGEIPPAARVQSEEGAEAFVKHFFQRFNFAWTKPEAGVIARLSAPDCDFCRSTEETASYLAKNKQRYAADPTELKATQAFMGAPSGQQFVEITLLQRKVDILDASGAAIATDPEKEDRYFAVLQWGGKGWSLKEVEKAP
ncbi:DUF6318 family protein [Oryzobacter sp. R7]|uniref:DUF6318 family protein n=1 Tax=Oryzobacter faecalis TaxID=3388656 RepID=UPI00398D4B4C